jgi:hypothetical protein
VAQDILDAVYGALISFCSMAVRMVEALRGERRTALARAEMLARMGL